MSEKSTTPDVVELAHRTFEAFSGGDLDAVTSMFAPETVWESVGLGTSFQGASAIRSFLEDWRGRYEDYQIEVEEVLDLGNGVALIKSHQSARLEGSRDHVRLPREVMIHAFVWERGVVTHIVSSGDTPEARATAERLAESRR